MAEGLPKSGTISLHTGWKAIVGGTGKYTGITGGGEFAYTDVSPTTEGTWQGISKAKGRYKLP